MCCVNVRTYRYHNNTYHNKDKEKGIKIYTVSEKINHCVDYYLGIVILDLNCRKNVGLSLQKIIP